jgi:L-lactate dehydrogenase complex protein LldF
VYRQASGHAYRSVYPGPVGAVLSPLLARERFAEFADLPRASSLCGACNEVCPVDIPIPDLLLRLRARGKQERAPAAAAPSLAAWARAASSPWAWRRALAAGGLAGRLPGPLRPRPLRVWGQTHELPPWRGGAFRKWLRDRERKRGPQP